MAATEPGSNNSIRECQAHVCAIRDLRDDVDLPPCWPIPPDSPLRSMPASSSKIERTHSLHRRRARKPLTTSKLLCSKPPHSRIVQTTSPNETRLRANPFACNITPTRHARGGIHSHHPNPRATPTCGAEWFVPANSITKVTAIDQIASHNRAASIARPAPTFSRIMTQEIAERQLKPRSCPPCESLTPRRNRIGPRRFSNEKSRKDRHSVSSFASCDDEWQVRATDRSRRLINGNQHHVEAETAPGRNEHGIGTVTRENTRGNRSSARESFHPQVAFTSHQYPGLVLIGHFSPDKFFHEGIRSRSEHRLGYSLFA